MTFVIEPPDHSFAMLLNDPLPADSLPMLFSVPVRFTVPLPLRLNVPRLPSVNVPPRLTVLLAALIVPASHPIRIFAFGRLILG